MHIIANDGSVRILFFNWKYRRFQTHLLYIHTFLSVIISQKNQKSLNYHFDAVFAGTFLFVWKRRGDFGYLGGIANIYMYFVYIWWFEIRYLSKSNHCDDFLVVQHNSLVIQFIQMPSIYLLTLFLSVFHTENVWNSNKRHRKHIWWFDLNRQSSHIYTEI